MNEIIKKDLTEAREVCPTTSLRLLREGALLVDVREPDEVAQVGFAGFDVVNIPLSQFEDRWAEVPRDRDVILACAVGVRSLKATYFLMYQGYDRVANMKPGIDRWVAKGFPIKGSGDAAGLSAVASSCCGGSAAAAPATTACCGGSADSKSCDTGTANTGSCC